jgi:hypothetical protein
MFSQYWCKLPEDGNYAETCGRKLILKYAVYRILHLLVLIEFVINFAKHGMNRMKVFSFYDSTYAQSPELLIFTTPRCNFKKFEFLSGFEFARVVLIQA